MTSTGSGTPSRRWTPLDLPMAWVDPRDIGDVAGLSPAHVDAIAGMEEGLSGGFVAEDARDASTTTPTTLSAWAAANLR